MEARGKSGSINWERRICQKQGCRVAMFFLLLFSPSRPASYEKRGIADRVLRSSLREKILTTKAVSPGKESKAKNCVA